MELEITPIETYRNIRNNAKWAIQEMDTRFFPDDYGEYYYAQHLKNAIEKPTVGMMAFHEAKTKPLLDYPNHFDLNKRILEEKSSTVKKLKQTFDNVLYHLYPKTSKIREFIIDEDRIAFDTIKKSKGYNWFDKLKLFLK